MITMKKRVVVAMSGGVDSSVAAALLKDKGYEVIGITMCFNLPEDFVSNGSTTLTIGSEQRRTAKKPRCCGVQGIEDARAVAHKLGIKHYVLNMQKVLQKRVINNFCFEYGRGRTPNPCVRCNQYVKFDALLKKALSLDAAYLATGHYSRIVKNKPGYALKKARDLHKDQSYFLYRLGQPQLKRMLFPLGDYTKLQVRQLARKYDLSVADKLESQEICFLPGTDYREFLKARISKDIKPGPIIDKEGNILGQHRGIAFYTIGQRKGLRVSYGYPLYIIKIDAKDNKIVVGRKKDALSKEFLVKGAHFISTPLKKKVAVKVKIRYNHRESQAQIIPFGRLIRVKLKTPQFAVTPGQSAVFYIKDRVLGGGIIEKVLD